MYIYIYIMWSNRKTLNNPKPRARKRQAVEDTSAYGGGERGSPRCARGRYIYIYIYIYIIERERDVIICVYIYIYICVLDNDLGGVAGFTTLCTRPRSPASAMRPTTQRRVWDHSSSL